MNLKNRKICLSLFDTKRVTMKHIINIKIVREVTFVLFLIVRGTALYINDTCELKAGNQGICINIHNCLPAIEGLKENIRPVHCGFSGIDPVVCCPKSQPLVTNVGHKSKELCNKYAPPPPQPPSDEYVPEAVGGVESLSKEFPHMAALGFKLEDKIGWYCGGSLINERYVLTAAHCLYHKDAGPVAFVRLGDLDLHNTTDEAEPQDFTVIERISHPDFKFPQTYNDIALLRLNRDVNFTEYVRPLCLQTEFEFEKDDSNRPTATGWGRTEYGGHTSDVLIKVTLDFFANEECNEAFARVSRKRIPNGIDDGLQVCAGGRKTRSDTCQGDSGGPLQLYNYTNRMYYQIGITSFGMACGTPGIPAIYTRISGYIGWIESII